MAVSVRTVENKLLAIPILFVVLRIWSFLLVQLTTNVSNTLPCGLMMVLLFLAVRQNHTKLPPPPPCFSSLFPYCSLSVSSYCSPVSLCSIILQGIGDSGQGFFNAIIFCLFNKKIRRALKTFHLRCWEKWRTKRNGTSLVRFVDNHVA